MEHPHRGTEREDHEGRAAQQSDRAEEHHEHVGPQLVGQRPERAVHRAVRMVHEHARQMMLHTEEHRAVAQPVLQRLPAREVLADALRRCDWSDDTHGEQHHDEEGGEDARDAPAQEGERVRVSFPARGDEETADHEEHVHAQPTEQHHVVLADVEARFRRGVAGEVEAVRHHHDRGGDDADHIETVVARQRARRRCVRFRCSVRPGDGVGVTRFGRGAHHTNGSASA